jgi:hypothetical protein
MIEKIMQGEAAMSTLEDIIDAPDHLEFKRAVAVKMFISDFKTEDICHLLNVSDSFPLRQNSCRLNRISTMGGNKGQQWQDIQRSSKVER